MTQGNNSLNPLDVLSRATQAVPSVRYALGIAGVAAAAAIVTTLTQGYTRVTIIAVALLLLAMFVLYLFSLLVTSHSTSIHAAGVVLLWAIVLFVITFMGFTATAAAMGWPCNWAEFLRFHSSCDQPTSQPPPSHANGVAPAPDYANGIEARAAKVCGGLVSGQINTHGSIQVDDLSVKGDTNGSITIAKNGVDIGTVAKGSYEQYTTCLLQVMRILSVNNPGGPSAPAPKPCRIPNNGVERYTREFDVNRDSGWRGGGTGYSTSNWCNELIASLRGEHPQPRT